MSHCFWLSRIHDNFSLQQMWSSEMWCHVCTSVCRYGCGETCCFQFQGRKAIHAIKSQESLLWLNNPVWYQAPLGAYDKIFVVCWRLVLYYLGMLSVDISVCLSAVSSSVSALGILYQGADKSLAWPTSRYILFDGENISFDANHIYIYSTNTPPIMMINRIYEHQNLLLL
jgi:hypothetical protein